MENKRKYDYAIQPLIYKGFEIHCIFNYSSGRSDYNIFAPDADYGYMAPNQTIESVLNDIDEKLSEHE